jgi:tripartite-type tricarboxylate transporter receptor subunit TctC
MNTLVRVLLAGFAVATLFSTNAVAQTASAYPRKPIKIVVPFDAGGGADAQIRSMTSYLQKELGQPFVIINMPGAGGTIGTADGLRQRGDGYTLVFTGSGPLVTQPFILDLPYNENDYTVISQLSNTPRLIVAHPKAPFNDCKGMMEYAKANPGKLLVGISAIGSTDHFGFEQLKMDYKVDMKLIPQGGGGPQKVAVVGGHVEVAAVTTVEASSAVKANQVKPLGLMATKRDADYPDVKTCAEYGYPVVSGVGYYLIGPKSLPADIVKRLDAAVQKTLTDPGYLETAKKAGLAITYMNGPDTNKEIVSTFNLYKGLAAKIGFKK